MRFRFAPLAALAVLAFAVSASGQDWRASSGSVYDGDRANGAFSPLPIAASDTSTNPAGPVLIDWHRLIGTLGIDGRDDDGDLFASAATCATGTDTTDFVCDPGYPNAVTTWRLTGASSALAATLTAPDEADGVFCRNSSTGAPCSTGGSCAAIASATHPVGIVVRDASADAYYLTNVIGASGCGATGNTTLTISPPLPVAAASGSDSFQLGRWDNVHKTPYWNAWAADTVLSLHHEAVRIPATNLATNGSLDSTCAGTWTETDAVGSLSQSTITDTNFSTSEAVYGTGCKISLRIAAGVMRSDAWAVDTTKGSAVSCSLVVGSTNGSNAASLDVRLLNGSSNAVISGAVNRVYGIGSGPLALPQDDRLFVGGKTVVVSASIAGLTSIKAEASWDAGAGQSLWIDDVLCDYGAPNAAGLLLAGVNPVFPARPVGIAAVGDSLMAESAVYGGFAKAFSERASTARPGLVLSPSPLVATAAHGGATASAFFAPMTPYLDGRHLHGDYLLSNLGGVDLLVATPRAAVAGFVRGIAKTARARGQLPVLLLPHPHSLDTTSTGTCTGDGALTCGAQFRATSLAIRGSMPF